MQRNADRPFNNYTDNNAMFNKCVAVINVFISGCSLESVWRKVGHFLPQQKIAGLKPLRAEIPLTGSNSTTSGEIGGRQIQIQVSYMILQHRTLVIELHCQISKRLYGESIAFDCLRTAPYISIFFKPAQASRNNKQR